MSGKKDFKTTNESLKKEGKVVFIDNKNDREKRKAFTLIELIVVLIIAMSLMAALFFVLKPTAENAIQGNDIKSEYRAIENALSQYYSNTNKYPKSGWNWNQENAYLPQDVIDKGWQYECSNNEVIITTPSINNPKVRVKVYKSLNKEAKNINPNATVGQSGDKLVITIPDRICEK